MSPQPDQYDDAYLERREKRLQNLSSLRMITLVSAVIAVALTAASIVGIPQGGPKELVIVSLGFLLWLVALMTYVSQRAQSAAEITIQREYEQWSAQESEKPKRKRTVHLTDDGVYDDDQVADLEDQHATNHLRRS